MIYYNRPGYRFEVIRQVLLAFCATVRVPDEYGTLDVNFGLILLGPVTSSFQASNGSKSGLRGIKKRGHRLYAI